MSEDVKNYIKKFLAENREKLWEIAHEEIMHKLLTGLKPFSPKKGIFGKEAYFILEDTPENEDLSHE